MSDTPEASGYMSGCRLGCGNCKHSITFLVNGQAAEECDLTEELLRSLCSGDVPSGFSPFLNEQASGIWFEVEAEACETGQCQFRDQITAGAENAAAELLAQHIPFTAIRKD